MQDIISHEYYMNIALKEAMLAYDKGEIPVGCIIVLNDKVISKGHNMVEQLRDSTAHAEILAMTSAYASLNNKYLFNSAIYCTLEPCMMCMGAIINSKIGTLVYGARDNSKDSVSYRDIPTINLDVIEGVRDIECKELLDAFFQNIRN